MEKLLSEIFTVKRPCLTEQRMKQLLEGKLYVGKKVKIKSYSLLKDMTYSLRQVREGVVVGLYPHMFTVEIDGFTEGFRYAQCFTRDNERVIL